MTAPKTGLKPSQPIILYTFGAGFDLPEVSPYCMKTEIQLQMAGLPYQKDLGGYPRAPKGKLPYIKDGDAVIADSTFIRQHIEWSYGVDFDAGYDLKDRALAWTAERMLEDHLGWAVTKYRWLDPVNFAKGPAHFFDDAPEAVREKLRQEAVVEVKERLHGHGLGRHSDEDILFLATRSVYSFSQLLGDKPYLLGDRPCGADATACGMLASAATPFFETDLRKAVLSCSNLRAYLERMMAQFYPAFGAALAA